MSYNDPLPPLERRDEDGESGIEAATQAVEDLRSSVTAFQSKTETSWNKTGERIDALEARLNRDNLSAGSERNSEEAVLQQRAFDRALRYGFDRLEADEKRALSTTNSEGGFTVPETFLAEVLKDVAEISPIRSIARVTNVGGTPVKIPRRTVRPTGSWEGEGASASESSSTYGQHSIDVFEARFYTDISNQLLEDSAVNMEQELRLDAAEEIARLEGNAFLWGTGSSEPEGIANDSALTIDTVADSAGELVADDLIDLFYAVKARYRNSGSWLMGSGTIAKVRKLKNSSGDYLWQDSLAAGQPPTILGRPVVEEPEFDNKESADADVQILFGNFVRGFRIFQRVGLIILPDRFSRAKESEVRFHMRMRVGSKLVVAEAIRGLGNVVS